MTDIDKFYEKWNWYAILFENFCDGDYFKMDEAFKINVIAFFNHLTYLHEKNNLKI